MAFDGSEGSSISLSTASGMTASWRSNHSRDPKAIFIGRDLIDTILGQTDCQGIRVYFGEDAVGAMQIIMVGADSDENDIIGTIADGGLPCPTRCSEANDLNS